MQAAETGILEKSLKNIPAVSVHYTQFGHRTLPTEDDSLTANPCQTCGACCASFRVSFYWGETDDAPGGTVPAQFTEAVSPQLCCMKGTVSKPVRCVALEGEVGRQVSCRIYEKRPSPCREFDALEADGSPNPRCVALLKQML
jgi:Fe-S-cluster containining protein